MGQVLTSENTLSTQSESLRKESSILSQLLYVELGVGGILVAWGLIYYFWQNGVGWLIFGGFILFLAVSHLVKSKENIEDADKFESGKSGEEFVTKILRNDLPDDCLILNDLDVEGHSRPAQIDHLIVTRAGLFAIETKAYSGTLKGKAEDEKWTQVKEYKGNKEKNRLTNPIQQNKYHVEILEEFIEKQDLPFEDRHIHSYVAMVNKYMDMEITGDTSNVDFAWYLPKKIKPQLKHENYSPKQIKIFLRTLDISLPDSFSYPPEPEATEAEETKEKTTKTKEATDEQEESSTPDVEDLKLGN